MKLSLVVPCFNEQDNIWPFVEECKKAFKERIESFEIVFVNDGSHDGTWDEMKKIYETEHEIKLINFSRNFGKEAAMYAGLQKASGEYVTIIDADLQQQPEVVVDMVEFLDKHREYDCVATYQEKRKEGKVISFFKKEGYKLLNKVCDIDFQTGASDFRTFRHNVVDSILEVKEYFRFSKGIFSWIGYNTHFMPYVVKERNAGKSSWSFKGLLRYALDGIMAFSTFPLRIATYIGGCFSIGSLVYMLVVIFQKLIYGIEVPGYPTLVVLILLVGGMQMLLLGIIGQYIAKIYIEGKKRPIYIVKEYMGDKNELDKY